MNDLFPHEGGDDQQGDDDAAYFGRLRLSGGNDDTKARKEDAQFFPTPRAATIALMRHESWFAQPRRIWEPAVGEGHIADVLAEGGHDVYGSDIRNRMSGPVEGWRFNPDPHDFLKDVLAKPFRHLIGLTADCPRHHAGFVAPDGIVTNPPYRELAEAFIRRAVHNYAYVAMLLKPDYWNALRQRAPGVTLWEECRPSRILACTWRLDFAGLDNPPMSGCWNIWDRDHTGPCEFHRLSKPHDPGDRPDDLFEFDGGTIT